VAGTAAGGVVAAAVGVVCVTPLSMAVAMFPLSIVALALRGVNFGLFMMAMTPLVVLLVETGQPGASEWIIALARAGFTALGGVVAVAASFALWPVREPERLVADVRSAIGAHGRYADAVLGQLPADPVIRARRAAGLSSNSLEGAITRSLLDPAAVAPSGDGRGRLEAALVIDAALRRFAGRVAAMRYVGSGVPPEALTAWRAWITGAMKGLAEGGTNVAPRPPAGGSETLLRIARQIELMAGAMTKVTV